MSQLPAPGDRDHVDDLLPLLAVGSIAPPERLAAETHLSGCERCRRELRGYRQSAEQLRAEARLAPPPDSLWPRIQASLDDRQSADATQTPGRWRPVRWLAFAAAIGVLFAAGGALTVALVQTGSDGDEFAEVATDDVVFTLAPIDPSHDANGRIFMNTARTQGVVAVAGLDPLPTNEAYAVWIVRDDQTRLSAGTFTVDAEGRAVSALTLPELPYEWQSSGRYVALSISRVAVARPDIPVGGAILVGPLY
jgi:hypothetical protein